MSTVHPIPPIYNENSKILILGSFPSVASRETGFFYGHKQNRFWRILAHLLNCSIPETVCEKQILLTSSGIALWDVISSCEIIGSSDSTIKNVIPNDISPILNCGINTVFTNGKTASALYNKYIYPKTNIHDICLPSTSPSNATYSFDRLTAEWKQIIKHL